MQAAGKTPDTLLTGIDGLDEVLCGGLPRSRIYLVQGNPGVGKTTLALQFLRAGAALGERCVYITLSETPEEIRDIAASHGWDLGGISIIELSSLEQTAMLEQQNMLFEASEVELQETTQRLLDHIERLNPERVVLDSLSELRVLAQGALRYRRQILGLKQYFNGRRSTALLLDDLTAASPDLQLQSMAHGVLHLEQHPPLHGEDRRRLRVVKLRGLHFRGGYHEFVIRPGGIAVFPRLRAGGEPALELEQRPISSGLPGLDRLLGGGLDRGTSTLITGPAGAGKSAIATQFALACALAGERAALFTFDESAKTLFARSKALGLDLAQHVSAGRIHVQQVDPAEMGPGEFAHTTRKIVEAGVQLVVIDSLNGYLNSMPEEKLLSVHLHELLSYLGQRNVATLLVMSQSGFVGRTNSPVDLSYLSDTVLLLRFFESAGRIRKAISVVKKRSGPHEDTIRELNVAGGIVVGEPLMEFSGVLTGVPRYLGNVQSLNVGS